MPDAVVMFKQLQPILDRSISKVYMQEAPLWSYKYRLAGRVDCVADIKGKLTVVDFKTSMKPKKKEIEMLKVEKQDDAENARDRT